MECTFQYGRLKSVYDGPIKKDNRADDWQRKKRMLDGAGKPDVPGLYDSRACTYWLAAVPSSKRRNLAVRCASFIHRKFVAKLGGGGSILLASPG